MKRFLVILIFLINLSFFSIAAGDRVRRVEIDCSILPNGDVAVHELWDIDVNSGTEWYLVKNWPWISQFKVLDGEQTLQDDGKWNTNRSLEQKAGRYGIMEKDGAVKELCWGVGNYGDHLFHVHYVMERFLSSHLDYDMIRFLFIDSDIKPEQIKVTIHSEVASLNWINTRVWTRGRPVSSLEEDGSVVITSILPSDQSLHLMIRFDKGLFNPDRYEYSFFNDYLRNFLLNL